MKRHHLFKPSNRWQTQKLFLFCFLEIFDVTKQLNTEKLKTKSLFFVDEKIGPHEHLQVCN